MDEYFQALERHLWELVNSGFIHDLDAMKTVDLCNSLMMPIDRVGDSSSSFLLDDWESSEDYVEI